MKTETILWLLPIVFMFHDFEEIVMFSPWIRKNKNILYDRYPKLAARFVPHISSLSTSAFAVMVGLMFLIISGLTLIAAEFALYSLWMGMMLLFFIHLLVHIAQGIAYRAYVPVILTSLIASIYCILAAFTFQSRGLIEWNQTGLWLLVLTVVFIPVFFLVQRFGAKVESWLGKTYPG